MNSQSEHQMVEETAVPGSVSARFASVFAMPGHLLRRCQQIAVGIFLDECEPVDLTPLQFVALATLHERGPLDQAALGRVAALDRTTCAVVTKALEARGCVRRAQSKEDRRSKVISLTEEGRRLLDQCVPHVEAAQGRILAPLREDEREELRRLLDKLASGNNAFSRAPMRDVKRRFK